MPFRASIIVVLCCGLLTSRAAEFFISTDATPDGVGTKSQPWELQTALNHPPSLLPGDTLWLRGGIYRGTFKSALQGEARRPMIVRALPDERVIIDGCITIEGQWTTYWGFEVQNSDPYRPEEQWTRPAGISVYGPHTKLINLSIHDGGQGIGCWSSATNAEIYGCLIYNNGNSHFDHGIYAQNHAGTMRIVDNIIFNNFGYGLHVFAEKSSMVGFEISGNIIFNNGSLSPAGDAQNILVGGTMPADRIRLIGNQTYGGFKPGSVTIGLSDAASPNLEVAVQDNYFADFVTLRNWTSAVVTGNTIIAPGTALELINTFHLPTSPVQWNRNEYFSSEQSRPFALVSENESTGYSFSEWRTITGFDTGSKYVKGSPPETKVFVRANQYEIGRASITIYNWGNEKTVPVNLNSVLPIGGWYEIRSAQDCVGPPILTQRYFGGVVHLPMTNATVVGPIGLNTPASLSPGFASFLVRKLDQFPKSEFLWR